MSGLPPNWAQAKFMDVFDIQGGTQPPKSHFRDEAESGYIRLLQIRDFGDNPVPTYIPDNGNLKKCTDQDILIARYGASLGRILTGFSGAYNVAMAKVDIPKNIHRRYVYYLLNSELFQEPLRFISRSAQSGFNKQDLSRIKLPLPPLSEQKRIADKLDILSERIDACQARLARVRRMLGRYRKVVLTAATSGQLTEDWREEMNLSFDSWQTKTGAEVFPFITSGSRGWAKYYADSGPIFLRVGNLAHGAIKLNLNEVQHVKPPSTVEGKRARIEIGDILISITADVGRVGFISENIGEAYINQHLCLARQNGDYLGAYLAYYLASPLGGLAQLTGMQRGVSKAGVTLGDIRALKIRMPKKEEQKEIVRRAEALFDVADCIETRYQAAQTQVEKLTPLILSKAFRGELVPQDPNDEPASILLERIRVERAAKPKTSKKVSTRKTPKRTKMNEKSVKAVIDQLPTDTFTFDELRGEVAGDYETLQKFVFDLLDEPEPSISQVFDKDSESMRFVRSEK